MAAERLRRMQLAECFDPFNLDSRPNSKQDSIFRDAANIQLRWVVAGNQSGKSSLAGREVAWVLQGEHPYWTRPEAWGDEPLLIIIAGQSRQMMEVELWGKKIKPFLDEAEWKEKRVGGQVTSIINQRTGDTILLLSHADGSEKNRKYMQGFVAHYVWMDEMPADIKILEELTQRVASKRGLFLGTFTPKVRNDRIRKFIDAAEAPTGKKYSLSKIDNPIYAERIQEEFAKLRGMQQHEIDTIMYGAWAQGETHVYKFDYDYMVEKPEGYATSWRHVEGSDPAISSKFGFTLWAEKPETGVWYAVKTRYIEKIPQPTKIVEEVIRQTKDCNMVRRVCDPHETWYINTALAVPYKLQYVVPFDKNSRKDELIKSLQEALSSGRVKIAPWCTDLIDEIQSCQWAENGTIVNGRSYHLLDGAQYFVDCCPKPTQKVEQKSYAQQLLDGHYARKKAQATSRVNRSGRSKWGVRSSGSFRLR